MRNTMYERLTKRDRYGHAYTNETIYDRGMTSEDGVHFEKHYFENGTSAYDGKPIDRLCELEDKIEQGKILELPCKVGDYVYRIVGENTPKLWIWHWEIVEIMIYQDEIVYRDDSDNIIENKDFGKTVFLTREEAEKALAERSENGKS